MYVHQIRQLHSQLNELREANYELAECVRNLEHERVRYQHLYHECRNYGREVSELMKGVLILLITHYNYNLLNYKLTLKQSQTFVGKIFNPLIFTLRNSQNPNDELLTFKHDVTGLWKKILH